MVALKLITVFGLIYVSFGYQLEQTTDKVEKEKRNEVECPPGFWCRKKDSLSLREQEDMKKNEIACPPGFWCKKKDSLSLREQEDMKKNEIACPPGFWCKKKDNTLVEENQKVKDDPSNSIKMLNVSSLYQYSYSYLHTKLKITKKGKTMLKKKLKTLCLLIYSYML